MNHRSRDRAALASMRGFEKVAFSIADTVNRNDPIKHATHAFLRTGGAAWVYHCTKNLVHLYQEANLASLAPDRGVLLVSNHRSFFDMYLLSSVILRRVAWVERMFFPVRSTFFYERPAGVLVNAVMSAMAMFPPVVRDNRRRSINQFAIDFLGEALARRGTLVGYHPEGMRGRAGNPYRLLPASSGIGHLVYDARPIVLPVFTLGLVNNFPRQIVTNFTRSGDPVTVVFGKPIDGNELATGKRGARAYQACADRLRGVLTELGEVERQYRLRDGLPTLGMQAHGGPAAGERAAPDPVAN